MIIISDTGPIIALAKINRLDLLKKIAKEVQIPQIIYKELMGKIGPETDIIENALNDFIIVSSVRESKSTAEKIISDLDEGEKQVFNLAKTFNEDILLIIDDKKGREAAKKLNIPFTGSIGIMLYAKEKGYINDVGSILENIRNHGYWLSDAVIDTARKLAGE